ncbi:MAG: hypothetical protein EOO42_16315 [Flavobacteriales bacterium]|nr:MAG: hypothetical protein EOO42_16315 [Flavobacteriales bacterium]
MKKIFVLTALMICYFTVQAQKEISTEKVISIDLPKTMEKLSKQGKMLYFMKRKNSRLLSGDNYKGLTYSFEDILFQVVADSGKLDHDRVERTKMAEDNMNAQITDQKYSSELLVVNKNKIVVFKREKLDYSYYEVIATNVTNNKIIVARMEYKKEDETKAKKLLDHFLKNLKFKD